LLADNAVNLKIATAIDLLTMAVGWSIALHQLLGGWGISGKTDFPAFYVAGTIINDGENLYDRDLQDKRFHDLAPNAPREWKLPFAYTPFFALLFAPLAMLPYSIAWVVWALTSFVLFTVGFQFLYSVSGLSHRWVVYLISLSFLPLSVWCLLGGQTSAFGFFWLVLAIYLDKTRKPFQGGLALSLMLYKPPLLILILPMLVITGRWKALQGFAIGGGILGTISLFVIGLSGIPSYLAMLGVFASSRARHPVWHSVDAYAFFLSVVHNRLAVYACFGAFAFLALVFLVDSWRKNKTDWTTAITWTMVINIYVLLYDLSFILIPLILSARLMLQRCRKITIISYAVLFLLPWVSTTVANDIGFQPLTLAIIAFGALQLWALGDVAEIIPAMASIIMRAEAMLGGRLVGRVRNRA
jgi:hypothetical protein